MQITSPNQNDHLETLAQMFAKTFSTYWDRRRYIHDGYVVDSGYDWEASRIAVIDDEVAGHFGVWDRTMRVGPSTIRVAAVGAVATLEHHRKKGLMAKTVADCVGNLDAAGYDVAMLFGIPNFYHKFDFVRSFPVASFHLTARDLPVIDPVPDYQKSDYEIDEFAGLYNRENNSVTGTFVRPTYRHNRKPKEFIPYRFDGGYVTVKRNDGTLQVADSAGEPQVILSVLKDLAYRELCPQVELTFLPRKSRLGEYVQTVAHRYQVHHESNGGPMFRMINLERTTNKLLPTFTDRLAESALADYSGKLLLSGNRESVMVSIQAGGAVAAESVPPGEERTGADATINAGGSLVRFYVGDDLPERISRQAGVTLAGAGNALLPILFPHEEPQTILWDRF